MSNEHPVWNVFRRWCACAGACAALVALSGCATELASDMKENEAQEIVTVLQQYGLHPTKKKLGEGKEASYTVFVPAEEASAANVVMKKFELPRLPPRGFGEVFSQTGLIPTATEEKAMFLVAIQGEIAKTLENMDGVMAARVHVVIPEKDPLAEKEDKKATSSVFIRYRSDRQPPTREEIAQMVSHAVEGLDPAQVAVVLKPIDIDQSDIRKKISDSGFIANNKDLLIMVLVGISAFLGLALIFVVLMLQRSKRAVLQLQLRRQ